MNVSLYVVKYWTAGNYSDGVNRIVESQPYEYYRTFDAGQKVEGVSRHGGWRRL